MLFRGAINLKIITNAINIKIIIYLFFAAKIKYLLINKSKLKILSGGYIA